MADLLERWVPDAATRKRILVDNPAALYGFEAGEKISVLSSGALAPSSSMPGKRAG